MIKGIILIAFMVVIMVLMGNIDFYKEMFITRIYYDIRYDVIKTFFQFDTVNRNLLFQI